MASTSVVEETPHSNFFILHLPVSIAWTDKMPNISPPPHLSFPLSSPAGSWEEQLGTGHSERDYIKSSQWITAVLGMLVVCGCLPSELRICNQKQIETRSEFSILFFLTLALDRSWLATYLSHLTSKYIILILLHRKQEADCSLAYCHLLTEHIIQSDCFRRVKLQGEPYLYTTH